MERVKMRKTNEHTTIAGVAIIGMAFLFLMTATEGKYWGKNDMDQYIIKITEGEDKAYLDTSTPTAMVISKFSSSPFLNRNCLQLGTCGTKETCTVVDNGYVINKGRKVAKASMMTCTTSDDEADRSAEDPIAYEMLEENR